MDWLLCALSENHLDIIWIALIWLVASIPLKNMNGSWDDDIPNIWKNKVMFQTTNQSSYCWYHQVILSQLGWFFSIYGKHMFQTTNQFYVQITHSSKKYLGCFKLPKSDFLLTPSPQFHQATSHGVADWKTSPLMGCWTFSLGIFCVFLL